ncbi:helix-hairpin-helix domain-containing protein [Streptomyces sp. Edi4]|uniref:helix-hairpin-helix domain-containing protein n=1 Tax=Streptomyces sp. Edi4 TaxID=3162527 RepID=UPI00330566B5
MTALPQGSAPGSTADEPAETEVARVATANGPAGPVAEGTPEAVEVGVAEVAAARAEAADGGAGGAGGAGGEGQGDDATGAVGADLPRASESGDDATGTPEADALAGTAGGPDADANADAAGTPKADAGADSAGSPEADADADADATGTPEADADAAGGQVADADADATGTPEADADAAGGQVADADADAVAGPDSDATADAAGEPEADPGDDAPGDAETDGANSDAPGNPEAGVDADGAGISEAAAELAAQRELRARIERRKAEKEAPIPAGTKLSGQAADLLAAVRAVEKGEKSGAAFFAGPPPAPRRPAPGPGPAQDAAAARPRAPEPAQPPATSAEALAAVRTVLTRGGAPETLAVQVTGVLGEQAAERLGGDPWQLLAVPGVRPEQADGFARALLGEACRPDDERRSAALVGWILEQAAARGHTALLADDVRKALAARSVPDPDEAVQQAVAEGVVLVFQDGLPDRPGLEEGADDVRTEAAPETEDGEPAEPVEVLLGLDRYALAEESLADGLARLLNAPVRDDGSVWPDAGELVRAVAGSGLVAHTGGEAARAESASVVTAAAAAGLRAAGAAHTVDGQRRLAQLTGPLAAFTVAGLLSADGPGRDAEGALALDVLVVQDATQLDVETAAMLVESLPDGCRLVLSGDPGVLRPAGAGLVFQDVLTARICPVVASRVPDPGPVGELVSGIGIGELNQVEAPGKEVVIVPVRDAGEAVHRSVQLLADSIPRAIGIPAEQTQVVTVGHGGSAGTRALNAALKQRLNPGPGRFGGFDPGDRVAYAEVVGRTVTGTVVGADAEGLRLDCAGTPVLVPKERVESALRHGWALTAHQAAGMRWPAVVVVLPGDAAQGLNRAWVYTAFGRAERHLSVVHGVDQALPRAVAEVLPPPRTTRLAPLLRGLLKTGE